MHEKHFSACSMEDLAPLTIVSGASSAGVHTKLASSRDVVAPEIRKAIDAAKPTQGKILVLVNAMSCGEYYGPNSNGDYFSEANLNPPKEKLASAESKYGYTTFYDAGVYRHHQNKDPSKSFGSIKVAAFNDKMKRVELLVEIDEVKAREFGHGDLVDKFHDGKLEPVSMGCRVKYDVCRIDGCGNEAPTRAHYCDHAANHMNSYTSDGQVVCVDNPKPVFFDLSFVTVNADVIGKSLTKVAHKQEEKTAALRGFNAKMAAIIKRIPNMVAKKVASFDGKEDDVSDFLLSNVKQHRIDDIVGALMHMGIVVSPSEFAALGVRALGDAKLSARIAAGEKLAFAPFTGTPGSVVTKPRLASVNDYELLEDRGVYPSTLVYRSRMLHKTASEKAPPTIVTGSNTMRILAEKYAGYRLALLQEYKKHDPTTVVYVYGAKGGTDIPALNSAVSEDIGMMTSVLQGLSSF